VVRGLHFAEAPAMSAPTLDTPVTTSASGYSDGFGRRLLAFEREDGAVFERLYLRPQFSIYERFLRETFTRLAAHGDSRIVAPRSIERDPESAEFIAVSPFVGGERLSDLLDAAAERARDDEAVPGIDVALGFLLDALPALEALRAATGISHGAIAPSRCVFTPDGRVVLTECGFAAVLQRLNLSRERLWREFSVAIPSMAGPARFDEAADVSQAALMAVMLIVGRPMSTADAVDVLPDWLAEVVEIAQIRGSVSFAVNLQRFLQRALPLPGRRPYQAIDAALHDVRQLATTIGADLCRAALVRFVQQASGAATPTVDNWSEDDASVEASHRVPDVPAADPIVPAAAPIPVEAFLEAEPIVAESWAADPAVQAEGRTPEPVAADPPVPEPNAESVAEPEAEPVGEPVPQPAPTRRRRWRVRRAERDTLRSAVAPPAPPEPKPTPLPVVDAPIVAPEPVLPAAASAAVIPLATAEPVAPAPAAVAPLPAIAQPAPEPVVLQPMAAQPVVPQPVFAPLPVASGESFWTPPVAAAPQAPAVLKVRPVPVVLPAPAPLKLKADPPVGFTGRPPRHEPPQIFSGYGEPRRGASGAGSRRPSWKFAAAAAGLMITVIAAGRAYLPDAPAVNAEATNAKPVTVAAPPPVTTGTVVVQTQPAGARVLLDGSPAGETPLRIVDVAPGRHVLTFVTSSATVRRTIKVEANKTLTLDVPVFSGWVAIFAPIVLEVSEEGRALGSTDQGRLLLPPGRHTLTLTNRDFGYSADHAVEIEAGEVRSLNLSPTGTVNLNAVPWAEVWIDGKKTGETPVANLPLPLGNREIIFRHPELGERKTMTRITSGAPIAVSVDFTR
jgi:PEGA domain